MDRLREIFQGAIACIIVVGAIGVTVLLIVQGRSLENIPAWLTLLLGAIAGTYFGQTGVAAGFTKATNGMLEAAQKIVQAQQMAQQLASGPSAPGPRTEEASGPAP